MSKATKTLESERSAYVCDADKTACELLEDGGGNDDGSLEDRVVKIEHRIDAEPRLAFALRQLLAYCQTPRSLEDIDETVGLWPEMKASSFSVRTVLSWMVETGGIEELGDRTCATFETTAAGNAAVKGYRESNPLESLFEEYPFYKRGFLKTLEACQSPRSKREIDIAFEGDPLLEQPRKVYPNFFTDKLERSGGLIWDAGWKTTPEGLSFLQERRE